MIRFAADENFNNDILRAVWRLDPTLDIIRVQDTEASGFDDPSLLEWLEKENLILLTHDVNTIPKHVSDHLKADKHSPGIFLVSSDSPISPIARDILLIAKCSSIEEWLDQIWFLPFR